MTYQREDKTLVWRVQLIANEEVCGFHLMNKKKKNLQHNARVKIKFSKKISALSMQGQMTCNGSDLRLDVELEI